MTLKKIKKIREKITNDKLESVVAEEKGNDDILVENEDGEENCDEENKLCENESDNEEEDVGVKIKLVEV